MNNDCLFCKFVDGSIPVIKVYEDADMIIINDIAPKANKHYLLIPKEHFALLSDMSSTQSQALGRCLSTVSRLTAELELEGGFRCVINQGDDAGQSVKHLHIHILGGQQLLWNPQ